MNPIDTSGISPSPRVDTDRKTGGAKADNGGGDTSPRQSSVLADDTVELTDTASRLSQLSAEVNSAPGVDTAKVDAIRQRIADGSYEVDAGRIADALIRQELEFA